MTRPRTERRSLKRQKGPVGSAAVRSFKEPHPLPALSLLDLPIIANAVDELYRAYEAARSERDEPLVHSAAEGLLTRLGGRYECEPDSICNSELNIETKALLIEIRAAVFYPPPAGLDQSCASQSRIQSLLRIRSWQTSLSGMRSTPHRVQGGAERSVKLKRAANKNEKRDAWVHKQRNKTPAVPWIQIFQELTIGGLAEAKNWDLPTDWKGLSEAYYRYQATLRKRGTS